MDEPQIEAIAHRAAKTALVEFLEILGVDVNTAEGRKAARDNWAWLTDTRVGTQLIRRTTTGAAITAILGGLGWLIVSGLKSLLVLGGTP